MGLLEDLVERARREAKDLDLFLKRLEILESLLRGERASRERPRGLVRLDRDLVGGAVVVGDVHGDLETLSEILRASNAIELARSGWALIFLGDYVDRGEEQAEVLALLSLLKEMLGSSLVALRGNHEPPEELPVSPHDYPLALRRLYGSGWAEAYSASRRVFDLLPYAAVAEGLAAFLHGGVPVFTTTSCGHGYACILDADSSIKALEEILWNDPTEDPDVEYEPSPRGAGFLWGERITEEFSRKTGLGFIVRGHEPAWEGYKLNHSSRVITLFSRKGAPYYNAYAAALIMNFRSFRGFSREQLIIL